MYVDVEQTDRPWRDVYRLCIGFINPRPIALVSSVSAGGLPNLAPFSFYNMVSANPPVVMFAPSFRRDGRPKDTLLNVRETGEFVVATVSQGIAGPTVASAAVLPREQSEFDFSGLTPIPATKVKPALVKEAAVNIECRLRQIITFADQPGAGNVIFGDVVAIHVAEWVLADDGLIDPHKLRTVGRLGGKWYADVLEPYELAIPGEPS